MSRSTCSSIATFDRGGPSGRGSNAAWCPRAGTLIARKQEKEKSECARSLDSSRSPLRLCSPYGGNLLVRIWRGLGVGDCPGLLYRCVSARRPSRGRHLEAVGSPGGSFKARDPRNAVIPGETFGSRGPRPRPMRVARNRASTLAGRESDRDPRRADSRWRRRSRSSLPDSSSRRTSR